MTSLITVLTTLKKYGVFGPKLITISNAYFINNQWVLPWPKNEILSKEVWSNHIRYNFFFTIFLGKFVKVKTRMVLSNLMPNNKALELNLFTDLFSLSFYCLAFNFFFCRRKERLILSFSRSKNCSDNKSTKFTPRQISLQKTLIRKTKVMKRHDLNFQTVFFFLEYCFKSLFLIARLDNCKMREAIR